MSLTYNPFPRRPSHTRKRYTPSRETRRSAIGQAGLQLLSGINPSTPGGYDYSSIGRAGQAAQEVLRYDEEAHRYNEELAHKRYEEFLDNVRRSAAKEESNRREEERLRLAQKSDARAEMAAIRTMENDLLTSPQAKRTADAKERRSFSESVNFSKLPQTVKEGLISQASSNIALAQKRFDSFLPQPPPEPKDPSKTDREQFSAAIYLQTKGPQLLPPVLEKLQEAFNMGRYDIVNEHAEGYFEPTLGLLDDEQDKLIPSGATFLTGVGRRSRDRVFKSEIENILWALVREDYSEKDVAKLNELPIGYELVDWGKKVQDGRIPPGLWAEIDTKADLVGLDAIKTMAPNAVGVGRSKLALKKLREAYPQTKHPTSGEDQFELITEKIELDILTGLREEEIVDRMVKHIEYLNDNGWEFTFEDIQAVARNFFRVVDEALFPGF